jgi:hypothetical protein
MASYIYRSPLLYSLPEKLKLSRAPKESVVYQHLSQTSWASNTLSLPDTLKERYTLEDADRVNAEVAEADAQFPMPLRVRFLSKKNARYSSRFTFLCEYGNSFDVILQGEGTYEEHEHKPLNPYPR